VRSARRRLEPCTEGLWVWAVDKAKVDPALGAKDATVILLDTEVRPSARLRGRRGHLANHAAGRPGRTHVRCQGLGSYKKTETHDIKIFALAVLLSSHFIYNSLGTIDDSAMDKLSLVVELTKYIRSRSDETNQVRPGPAASHVCETKR